MIPVYNFPDDNTYTLNSLKNILQCNRLTAEKYIEKGNYKKTTKTYNGNKFTAWIIPQNEIMRIASNLAYTQHNNEISETSVNKTVSTDSNVTSVNVDTSMELLRNIKDLNSKINILENEKYELSKEVKSLINDKSILQADLSQANSKILLIEDKSNAIESAWSKSQQELKSSNEELEKVKLDNIKKDKVILLLYCALGGIALIGITILITLSLLKTGI